MDDGQGLTANPESFRGSWTLYRINKSRGRRWDARCRATSQTAAVIEVCGPRTALADSLVLGYK